MTTKTDVDLLQPCSYQIPGTFTVLQGIHGDGVINTLHSSPKFPSPPASAATTLGRTPITKQAQEAIDAWSNECIESAATEASEWLEMVKHQLQVQNSKYEHLHIPILSSLDSSKPSYLWWLKQGKLCVFDTLPQPSMAERGGSFPVVCTVAPGAILNGRSLHTWEKQGKNWGGEGGWLFKAVCTSATRRKNGHQLPTEHRPKPGRLQFLEIEAPNLSNSESKVNNSLSSSCFVIFSVDGYCLLTPGTASSCPLLSGLQLSQDNLFSRASNRKPTKCSSVWWWKVTCAAGAVVREGLELGSSQIAMLPYGTPVQVTQKVVNPQGLSRLQIRALAPSTGRPTVVKGWCSEHLNPRSGQRGPILQPIPPAVPLQWRVVLKDGAMVRQQAELNSGKVKLLPEDALVPVLARTFSEFPSNQCVPRLKLAPQNAYASLYLNNGSQCTILEPTKEEDSAFDPDQPGLFHWALHCQWAEPRANGEEEPDALRSSSSSAASTQKVMAHPEVTCVVCLESPANAMLVHGRTGHICCCLECARLCKAENVGCPLCRKTIDKVILHFYT